MFLSVFLDQNQGTAVFGALQDIAPTGNLKYSNPETLDAKPFYLETIPQVLYTMVLKALCRGNIDSSKYPALALLFEVIPAY